MGLAGGLATNGGGTSNASREAARNAAIGFQGASWDMYSGGAVATGALTSQYAYFLLAGFNAGDVVTNIVTCVTTAGAGTVPTGLYVGLYSAAGTLLADSANLASSSIWTSTGFAVAPLLGGTPGPYTIPTTGGYYLMILENGAFATTPMQVVARGLQAGMVKVIGAGVPFAGVQTAQVTPPSPATIVGNSSVANIWLGWS